MCKLIKYGLVLLWLLGGLYLHAQTSSQTHDAIKLQRLKKEVSEHYFSNGKQAMGAADEAILLGNKLKDTLALADLYKMYGVMLYFGGDHQKALEFYF